MRALVSIFNIAKAEVLQAWREKIILVTLATSILFMLGAAWVSWQYNEQASAERSRYQNAVRQNWLQQPDRHPHRASHYGYLAFRPPAPMSFLDPGVERYSGTSIFLEPHRQNFVNFSEVTYSTGLLRLGEMSPSLVIQVLAPLIVILAGFQLVGRDRQSGTLALLVSQGASMRAILSGKALGLAVVSVLPFIAGLSAIGICAAWRSSSLDDWLRCLLYIGGQMVYLLVWVAIVIVASALFRGSRASLVALLGLWLAIVIVGPRFLVSVVGESLPAISRSDLEAQAETSVMKEGDAHNPHDPLFATFTRDTLKKYGVSKIEDLPFNYSGLVMSKGEEHTSHVFQEWLHKLRKDYETQERILTYGAFFNPYLAIRGFSAMAAGSDRLHHADFEDAAESFRYTNVQHLNELHRTAIRYGANDRAQKVDKNVWSSFPEFQYHPPGVAWALSRSGVYLASLIFWTFAALMFMTIAARRCPVTERS